MLATPVSRLNISCHCTECTTFLRPSSKDRPSVRIPPGLSFELPPTPALTRKPTPHSTPTLRPTAPTLALSPSFLLTRPPPSKPKTNTRAALPSTALSPIWRVGDVDIAKAMSASRRLWAGLSSPIDEASTPLSAKTPGLSSCARAGCAAKVVPGFGRAVCKACEEELQGAVLGLAVLLDDEAQTRQEDAVRATTKSGRTDSLVAFPDIETSEEDEVEVEVEVELEGEEVRLFALPSTPPSTKLLLVHSLTSTPEQNTARQEQSKQYAEPPLFALPNVSLDARSYEDITPTTKYAMDFPALPTGTNSSKRTSREITDSPKLASKAESKAGSKRSSREILTATESTLFSLHASNASMKWKLRDR